VLPGVILLLWSGLSSYYLDPSGTYLPIAALALVPAIFVMLKTNIQPTFRKRTAIVMLMLIASLGYARLIDRVKIQHTRVEGLVISSTPTLTKSLFSPGKNYLITLRKINNDIVKIRLPKTYVQHEMISIPVAIGVLGYQRMEK
jgi:hypothetical protein